MLKSLKGIGPEFAGVLISADALAERIRRPRTRRLQSRKPAGGAVRIVDMSNLQCLGRVRRHLHPHAGGAFRASSGIRPLSSALALSCAQQAIGHGIRAKRSKAGAISFDFVQVEGQIHATV
jgi:hypothetical protein